MSAKPANQIFGSVAESEVLKQMKVFGVTLDEGMGAFAEGPGIEKGRIKAVGKYRCTFFAFTPFDW